MVNLFFSTMVSENGFLLVSGSERHKLTVLDERQRTVQRSGLETIIKS